MKLARTAARMASSVFWPRARTGERERQRRTYENAGGGRWFLWAPEDVPLVARLAAVAGRSEEAGEVMERVRVAWVAEIATDKEGS